MEGLCSGKSYSELKEYLSLFRKTQAAVMANPASYAGYFGGNVNEVKPNSIAVIHRIMATENGKMKLFSERIDKYSAMAKLSDVVSGKKAGDDANKLATPADVDNSFYAFSRGLTKVMNNRKASGGKREKEIADFNESKLDAAEKEVAKKQKEYLEEGVQKRKASVRKRRKRFWLLVLAYVPAILALVATGAIAYAGMSWLAVQTITFSPVALAVAVAPAVGGFFITRAITKKLVGKASENYADAKGEARGAKAKEKEIKRELEKAKQEHARLYRYAQQVLKGYTYEPNFDEALAAQKFEEASKQVAQNAPSGQSSAPAPVASATKAPEATKAPSAPSAQVAPQPQPSAVAPQPSAPRVQANPQPQPSAVAPQPSAPRAQANPQPQVVTPQNTSAVQPVTAPSPEKERTVPAPSAEPKKSESETAKTSGAPAQPVKTSAGAPAQPVRVENIESGSPETKPAKTEKTSKEEIDEFRTGLTDIFGKGKPSSKSETGARPKTEKPEEVSDAEVETEKTAGTKRKFSVKDLMGKVSGGVSKVANGVANALATKKDKEILGMLDETESEEKEPEKSRAKAPTTDAEIEKRLLNNEEYYADEESSDADSKLSETQESKSVAQTVKETAKKVGEKVKTGLKKAGDWIYNTTETKADKDVIAMLDEEPEDEESQTTAPTNEKEIVYRLLHNHKNYIEESDEEEKTSGLKNSIRRLIERAVGKSKRQKKFEEVQKQKEEAKNQAIIKAQEEDYRIVKKVLQDLPEDEKGKKLNENIDDINRLLIIKTVREMLDPSATATQTPTREEVGAMRAVNGFLSDLEHEQGASEKQLRKNISEVRDFLDNLDESKDKSSADELAKFFADLENEEQELADKRNEDAEEARRKRAEKEELSKFLDSLDDEIDRAKKPVADKIEEYDEVDDEVEEPDENEETSKKLSADDIDNMLARARVKSTKRADGVSVTEQNRINNVKAREAAEDALSQESTNGSFDDLFAMMNATLEDDYQGDFSEIVPADFMAFAQEVGEHVERVKELKQKPELTHSEAEFVARTNYEVAICKYCGRFVARTYSDTNDSDKAKRIKKPTDASIIYKPNSVLGYKDLKEKKGIYKNRAMVFKCLIEMGAISIDNEGADKDLILKASEAYQSQIALAKKHEVEVDGELGIRNRAIMEDVSGAIEIAQSMTGGKKLFRFTTAELKIAEETANILLEKTMKERGKKKYSAKSKAKEREQLDIEIEHFSHCRALTSACRMFKQLRSKDAEELRYALVMSDADSETLAELENLFMSRGKKATPKSQIVSNQLRMTKNLENLAGARAQQDARDNEFSRLARASEGLSGVEKQAVVDAMNQVKIKNAQANADFETLQEQIKSDAQEQMEIISDYQARKLKFAGLDIEESDLDPDVRKSRTEQLRRAVEVYKKITHGVKFSDEDYLSEGLDKYEMLGLVKKNSTEIDTLVKTIYSEQAFSRYNQPKEYKDALKEKFKGIWTMKTKTKAQASTQTQSEQGPQDFGDEGRER